MNRERTGITFQNFGIVIIVVFLALGIWHAATIKTISDSYLAEYTNDWLGGIQVFATGGTMGILIYGIGEIVLAINDLRNTIISTKKEGEKKESEDI